MNLRSMFSAAIACVALSSAASAQVEFGSLTLGDFAPALNIDVIKGDPVNLEDGRNKHVYIVEFWATWCGPCKYSIPHLTKLQEKYRDDGLIVIGISDEDEKTIRPYVEHMGDVMAYTVAVDRRRGTKSSYMDGFGETGIPRAYVVDVNGRVIWYGNPMKPFMDRIVEIALEDIPKDAAAFVPSPAKEDETGPEAAEEGDGS